MTPEAEALREALCRVLIQAKHDIGSYEESLCDRVAVQSARTIVEELRLAEPEIHVPNALAHKLLPLLELAGPKE